MLSEIKLPAPVHAITEVKVDGNVLATSAYRLDGGHILVRIDGSTWPSMNSLALADTQVGTWSVTAQYGETIPTGAAIAIGELSCEFLKGMSGHDCRFPHALKQLSPQPYPLTIPHLSPLFHHSPTAQT